MTLAIYIPLQRKTEANGAFAGTSASQAVSCRCCPSHLRFQQFSAGLKPLPILADLSSDVHAEDKLLLFIKASLKLNFF